MFSPDESSINSALTLFPNTDLIYIFSLAVESVFRFCRTVKRLTVNFQTGVIIWPRLICRRAFGASIDRVDALRLYHHHRHHHYHHTFFYISNVSCENVSPSLALFQLEEKNESSLDRKGIRRPHAPSLRFRGYQPFYLIVCAVFFARTCDYCKPPGSYLFADDVCWHITYRTRLKILIGDKKRT